MKIKTIKRIILSAFLFFSFLAFSKSALAANYYVDCSASTNGNGAYESPWNNLPSVNAKTFATGDDIYFKVGTTCYLNADSDRLQVDWSGTGSNRVIIGAYYGNGQFGLGGFERPIIDGRNTYPNNSQGGVDIRNRSYVTIKDLKIQNMGGIVNGVSKRGRSLIAVDSSYINVENCHLYRPYGNCIIYSKVNTGNIIDSIAEECKYPDFGIGTFGGAAIEVTGMGTTGATKNILVAGNLVIKSAHEGIGFYKKVENSIVEYNTIRDMTSYHIYSDASANNTFRYNLSYNSTAMFGRKYAIAANNEPIHSYCFGGNNKFYGNFVAGADRGISLGNQKLSEGCQAHAGTKIYHNTFVDCNTNITFWNPSTGQDVDVANNISIITSENSTGKHVNTNSPAGVTWSHNLFRGGTLPTGNAATNMIIGDPKLSKTSGWRNIAPDALSANHFKLLSGSAAIDKGLALGSPYNIDYFKTSRPQGSAWDIGAHEFTSGTTTISGDLNGDGKVDIFDYTIFIQDFGKTGSNLISDLNKDGKVDIFDYTIFSQNFGKTN
jgi:hypothetical protein